MPKPAGIVKALVGIRVLVVDDYDDARHLFRRVLESAGATVTEASSAATAFEAFCDATPNIIVSDIAMPGEDGCSLIQRIRAQPTGQSVPAIAVTGFGNAERERALAAGFQAYLLKPVEPAVLRASVLALVSGRNT